MTEWKAFIKDKKDAFLLEQASVTAGGAKRRLQANSEVKRNLIGWADNSQTNAEVTRKFSHDKNGRPLHKDKGRRPRNQNEGPDAKASAGVSPQCTTTDSAFPSQPQILAADVPSAKATIRRTVARFRSYLVQKRQYWAVRLKLCFICLRQGHRREGCPKRKSNQFWNALLTGEALCRQDLHRASFTDHAQ
ncbi:hypothetical protein Tsp_09910 [Trichinella spiralis]|uniref:hypothetical protein n=1 Tax=Trichinella spiralis TaxID=6334 RepID=UPI0001EFDE36|nr:hypothetical protein Tsp_09910 [Trichinella spiralis]